MTQSLKQLATALLLFAGSTTPLMAQKHIDLLVGTYCNTPEKGIYSYEFNQETGVAKPLQELKMMNPSFLTTDAKRKMIYAVSEVDNEKAAVYAIKFNTLTGRMTIKNIHLTKSIGPCHVATNGRLLVASNYTGGSLSVFDIAPDGDLRPLSQLFHGTTAPSDLPNQSTPHVHCAHFSPNGKFVVASNFSANQLYRFRITSDNKLEAPVVAGEMPRNSGPRHFRFHNGRVYVINELSGTVCVFQQSEAMPMKLLQEIPSDTVGGHGSADIHVSPDGRFLYTSNRLKADGIAIFSINPHNGLLTKVGYQLTGKHPRNFNITPNGKFLLCACRDDNKIQVFSINPQTGMLTNTHQDIMLEAPVCIDFMERRAE